MEDPRVEAAVGESTKRGIEEEDEELESKKRVRVDVNGEGAKVAIGIAA